MGAQVQSSGYPAAKSLIYRVMLNDAGYQSSLDTVLKVVEMFVPSRFNAPMITTAINAAIDAYSIAVTARLSDRKTGTRFLIAANMMQ